MKQPNEATAQAEVDRPAVCDDTIMALQGERYVNNNCFVIEAGLPIKRKKESNT